MLGYVRFDHDGVSNEGAGTPDYADIGAYEAFPKLVHFSDWWVADRFDYNEYVVIAYDDSTRSDILGSGDYPSTESALTTVLEGEAPFTANSLDGIAVYPGTRVRIYPDANYSGDPNLDIVGPAVIFNVWWKDRGYNYILTEDWDVPYQTLFPPSRRAWSDTEMTNGEYLNYWVNFYDDGSMKIE